MIYHILRRTFHRLVLPFTKPVFKLQIGNLTLMAIDTSALVNLVAEIDAVTTKVADLHTADVTASVNAAIASTEAAAQAQVDQATSSLAASVNNLKNALTPPAPPAV